MMQQPPYQMGQAQLSGHQELPQPMTTLTRQVSATANAAGVTVQHTTKLSSPGNISDILERFAGSSPLEDVAPGSSSSSARYRKYMLCVCVFVRVCGCVRTYLYVSHCVHDVFAGRTATPANLNNRFDSTPTAAAASAAGGGKRKPRRPPNRTQAAANMGETSAPTIYTPHTIHLVINSTELNMQVNKQDT
jgi:hypothetical protein